MDRSRESAIGDITDKTDEGSACTRRQRSVEKEDAVRVRGARGAENCRYPFIQVVALRPSRTVARWIEANFGELLLDPAHYEAHLVCFNRGRVNQWLPSGDASNQRCAYRFADAVSAGAVNLSSFLVELLMLSNSDSCIQRAIDAILNAIRIIGEGSCHLSSVRFLERSPPCSR